MKVTIETKRFEEICEIEPGIAFLYETAKGYHANADEDFCANRVWYGGMKRILINLVGWEAVRPELRSSEDYNIAYDTVYEALPDCRHQGLC